MLGEELREVDCSTDEEGAITGDWREFGGVSMRSLGGGSIRGSLE